MKEFVIGTLIVGSVLLVSPWLAVGAIYFFELLGKYISFVASVTGV